MQPDRRSAPRGEVGELRKAGNLVLVGGLRVRRQTDGISSKVKFAPDSPQEGDGFEPSVPGRKATASRRTFVTAMTVPERASLLSSESPAILLQVIAATE
jgi:hypothetical protein